MNKRIRAKREAQAIKEARAEAINQASNLELCLREFRVQKQAADIEIAAERGKIKLELAKAQQLAEMAYQKSKNVSERQEKMDEWIDVVYQNELELKRKERQLAEIAKHQKTVSKWQNVISVLVLLASIFNVIAAAI